MLNGFLSELKQNNDIKLKKIIDWTYVSSSLKLSEKFIIEFKDKVDWEEIASNQNLSKDFILKFEDKMDWELLEEYQNITKKDIEEHKKQKLEKNRVKNKFQLIRF